MMIETERSADPSDKASALEDMERMQALAAARRPTVESHPDFDGEHCVECGNEIPLARLKLRKVKCVECQSALEVQQKMRGIR